jgi:hypothetical protein
VIRWSSETKLFEWLRPRLRGEWDRCELIFPAGIADAIGIYDGATHWLELKIGKPSIDKMEPEQISFATKCHRHGAPYWVCFGYRGEALFFRYLFFHHHEQPVFLRPRARNQSA